MAQSISVQDFNKLPLDADSIVLDTRNTLDYTKNHLSHSLSIPAAILPRQLKNLDPKKLYYILSYTGRRSEALADQLTANGFRAVYIPRLYLRVSPLAADGGQLGILFNLDAPSGCQPLHGESAWHR